MTTTHRVLAAVAVVLGIGAAASDARSSRPSVLKSTFEIGHDSVSAPDLASSIMRRDPSLRILDVRGAADYERFHVPTATRTTLDELASVALPATSRVVIYGDRRDAIEAWAVLRSRGYSDVRVLREGVYEWIVRVHAPSLAADATPDERVAFAQAAEMSRYFGGGVRVDVARAELPAGYWTGASGVPNDGRGLVAAIRRRGC